MITVLQSGERLERVWVVSSALAASVPFLFGQPIFVELGGAGYSIIALALMALWSAEGIERVWTRWCINLTLRTRRFVAVFAITVFGVSVVPGWYHTYAFMEEYRFLRAKVAPHSGTVLALFDTNDKCYHDIDASVALADALLVVRNPNLHWHVLNADDWGRTNIQDLRFDYYYQGSLLSLDPSSMEDRYNQRVNPDPVSRACLRERLKRLHQIDQAIRSSHALVKIEEEPIVARSFSFVGFANNRATLVLYRH